MRTKVDFLCVFYIEGKKKNTFWKSLCTIQKIFKNI